MCEHRLAFLCKYGAAPGWKNPKDCQVAASSTMTEGWRFKMEVNLGAGLKP